MTSTAAPFHAHAHAPGDICPRCQAATIEVASSQRMANGSQTRYLKCDDGCGFRGKQNVPVDVVDAVIRRRTRRIEKPADAPAS
jgi:hypothetical protein